MGKLKPVDAPFEKVEFSPYEFGKVIAMVACGLEVILKDVPKSRRYQLDLKMYQVTKKGGGKK